MEHNNMHANMHWGYGAAPVPSTPQSHWIPPPTSHSLKRALSESDCEELFSEESSKEQISPGESGGVHMMSRKKRRGVIEKKRRDRINSSLSELKRLVPTAFEKQGSAKLEKAEILQLTVEHLKNLNSKGMDSLNFDAQRLAMDYHIIGFRECAAEVARYLVTIEGMDIQDPLRLRLMSHLQYFVQQREISAKSCSSSSSWTAPATSTPNVYQNNCAVAPYQGYGTNSSSYVPNLPMHPYPALNSSPIPQQQQQQHHHHHQQQQTLQQNPHHQNSVIHRQHAVTTTVTSTNDNIALLNQNSAQQTNTPHVTHSQPQTQTQNTQEIRSPSHHQPHSTHQHHYNPQQQQQPPQQQQQQQSEHNSQDPHNQQDTSTYIELTSRQSAHRNPTPEVSSTGVTYAADTQYNDAAAAQGYNTNANLNYVGVNGAKPYRPWGAEMAY